MGRGGKGREEGGGFTLVRLWGMDGIGEIGILRSDKIIFEGIVQGRLIKVMEY